jgi:serpin B
MMLANGAKSDHPVIEELRHVFALPADVSIDDLHQKFTKLLAECNQASDPKVQLAIANSIWMRGIPKASFVKACQNMYDAEVRELTTADPINQWCASKTNGRIDHIIDDGGVKQIDLAALLNAVYFKGAWKNEFKESLTKPRTFRSLSGRETEVVTMYQHRTDYKYTESAIFQMVELPYGDDGSMVSHIILPRADYLAEHGMNGFLQSFNMKTLRESQKKLLGQSGHLYLPRFKFEYSVKLNDALIQLGMPTAFDSQQGAFTEIRDDAAGYVSLVKHKTFVECNEQGTEAAAVTMIGLRKSCAVRVPVQEFRMDCNHPFVFTISKGKLLLFAGIIESDAAGSQ